MHSLSTNIGTLPEGDAGRRGGGFKYGGHVVKGRREWGNMEGAMGTVEWVMFK